MLTEISYFMIFGRPLIMYLGIVTLLMFLLTASIAILNMKEIDTIPFVWHPRLAVLSIFLALVHGMLGNLAYFKKKQEKIKTMFMETKKLLKEYRLAEISEPRNPEHRTNKDAKH